MDEFDLIRRYFTRQTVDHSVVTGIGDDGAVVVPDPGRELIAVVDTQIESVHFPRGFTAAEIGYRAVAINLSDIAAMGGRPRWMTLALTLTEADGRWLESFASGLFEAAAAHGVALIGGDTTRGKQLTMSVQVIGDVEAGNSIRRTGAKSGDRIYVSGTVGDAAAALRYFDENRADDELSAYFRERFARPVARVSLGRALQGVASAAIDVSDGLAADCQKMLQSSGCGGELSVDAVPVSEPLRQTLPKDVAQDLALNGGDDYELCFTAAAGRSAEIERLSRTLKLPITAIGHVNEERELVCLRNGKRIEYNRAGYLHFERESR